MVKIGIDDKILNKRGKLTEEEFEIMKQHTVIGASILEELTMYQDEPLVKTVHIGCADGIMSVMTEEAIRMV